MPAGCLYRRLLGSLTVLLHSEFYGVIRCTVKRDVMASNNRVQCGWVSPFLYLVTSRPPLSHLEMRSIDKCPTVNIVLFYGVIGYNDCQKLQLL